MQGLLNNLLVSSDPFTSSLKIQTQTKKKNEAKSLLIFTEKILKTVMVTKKTTLQMKRI